MDKVERLQGMLWGAFVADAFALGPHWIYDTHSIQRFYGHPEDLTDPLPDSYHTTKKKGDFTHYGDQMLLLLESLVRNDGFVADSYCSEWISFINSYAGYHDTAMRTTYSNLKKGISYTQAASQSKEFSAVGRIAPVLYWYAKDKKKALKYVTQMVSMTHNDPLVVETARFFTEWVFDILEGDSPVKTLKRQWGCIPNESPLKELIRMGMDLVVEPSHRVIIRFGSQCSLKNALPSTIQMIIKYSQDYRTAMVENVIAGGDSAARGMAIGMVLGAWNGIQGITKKWKNGLWHHSAIEQMINLEHGKMKSPLS